MNYAKSTIGLRMERELNRKKRGSAQYQNMVARCEWLNQQAPVMRYYEVDGQILSEEKYSEYVN